MIKELKKQIRIFIKKYDVRYLGIFTSYEDIKNEIPFIGEGIFLSLINTSKEIGVTLFSNKRHINETLIQELKIHLPQTPHYYIHTNQITFIYHIT